jgi:hypothetical protein
LRHRHRRLDSTFTEESVMPRLIAVSASETPALLALRRTLWQLAILGIAIAATLTRIAPQSDALALWCALIPLSALAMHFRHALWNAMSFRLAHVDHALARRTQRPRPQARRARGQLRVRLVRDAAKVGPLAR